MWASQCKRHQIHQYSLCGLIFMLVSRGGWWTMFRDMAARWGHDKSFSEINEDISGLRRRQKDAFFPYQNSYARWHIDVPKKPPIIMSLSALCSKFCKNCVLLKGRFQQHMSNLLNLDKHLYCSVLQHDRGFRVHFYDKRNKCYPIVIFDKCIS